MAEHLTETRQDNDVNFSMVIASAVHDMKNSLSMLLHSLDELREEHGPELTESKRFNTLQYEAQRVHGDLVQLLGLYRLQEDKLTPHVDEHHVPDFLALQLARHQPLLEGRNILCTLQASEISGYFDHDLIGGILTNTINNAIRYTRSKIALAAREEDGYLIISVSDDGQGYPQEMLDDPKPCLNSLDFDTGSTSLGLYFASSVANLHRNGERSGFILLSNGGPLGGGVFEVWLP